MKNLNRFIDIKGIGQIKGPIPNKNKDGSLINLIDLLDIEDNVSIIKLGIQAPKETILNINNEDYHIGKTGILEYETGVNITYLAFKSDITKNVIIDFVCDHEKKGE